MTNHDQANWAFGDGDDTAFEGLHPNLQSKLKEAQAIMRSVRDHMEQNHITDIGITQATEGVSEAFFAAVDRTGDKAQKLGYTPQVFWTGQRVDLYEVPAPVIVSVGSTISHRAALVWVSFTDVDLGGYGDWKTAICDLVGVYTDLDSAHQALAEIGQAIRTISRAASMADATRGEKTRGGVTTGPSF